MRIWILASLTALVAVAGLADAPRAAEPGSSPGAPGTAPPLRGSTARARVFPVANAWVNSLKQEAEAPPAPAPNLRPAITGLNLGQGSGGAPTESSYAPGAVIAPTAWNHEHTYSGYVFGPGSCDYTPPCVNHLWDGYCQRPLRCGHHHLGHFRGHFGGGCATCGPAISGGCDSCGGGGGYFSGCHACKLHHLKHKVCAVFDNGCNSCAAPCTTCAAPVSVPACGCGCGHKLFGGLHRGWFGSLCSACDGGMSCGCGAPVDSHGPPAAAPAANPEVVPTPAADGPMDAPDADAKSARGGVTRYLPWSIK